MEKEGKRERERRWEEERDKTKRRGDCREEERGKGHARE